ncbi:Hypp3197 [Branchiostoma lanceolatum]|uniref:Choline monooxygenase, chloroplastic n=1 Tax=Branchiostoma lanceolatum TaxID=7740 RepID=A0A8K0A2R5_BRALA|nr:Hypp3197 [Branchiostoma lanceolatum]
MTLPRDRAIMAGLCRIGSTFVKRLPPVLTPFLQVFTKPLSTTSSSVTTEVHKFCLETPIDEATTPPASWYADDRLYDLEIRTVFRRNWVAVGVANQVAKPGQFFTGVLGNDPFVVVRDHSDQLRAFYNVCRHRANIVVQQEEGQAQLFTCCYHGWTYRLNGRLSKALRLRGIKNFSARENGLKPVAVRTWGPVVLVQLEGDGRGDFEEKTSPLLQQLDTQGFAHGMRHICRRFYDTKCNWKLLVENAQDHNSHVECVHKHLAKIVDLPSTKVEATELYSKMTGLGVRDNEQSTEGQRYGQAGYIVANVFPNLAVNRYGPWLDTNLLLPLAADRTRIVMDYFLEEDFVKNTSDKELAGFVETSLKDSDHVQKEDNGICESVQKGLSSSAYDVGRYLPSIEHGPHMFHVFLGTELRKGLET